MGKFVWLFKGLILVGLSVAVFGSAGWFAYQLLVVPHRIPAEEAVRGLPTPPPDPSLPEFERVMKLVKSRKLLESRSALDAFLDNYPYSSKLKEARTLLGQINTDIFFSAIPAPEKTAYQIRPGDALVKIERRFKTSRELLMRSNNLDDPTRLRVGQVLLVSQPEFSVIIDRKEHTVTLLNRGRFFKQYNAIDWNVSPPKKGTEKVPISAKVNDVIAWRDGARVNFGTKEYSGSARWVEINAKGYTLYTEDGQKPAAGISFSPEDMEELSTLLGKNRPVTIQ